MIVETIKIDTTLLLIILISVSALIFSHLMCYHHGKYKAYTHALKMYRELVTEVEQAVEREKENEHREKK